jgi:superfamily II DNA or RNA helicase
MATELKCPLPPKILLAGWTEIPLSHLRCRVDQLQLRLQRDLIFRTQDSREFSGSDYDRREEIRCYKLANDRVCVPRYYLERLEDLVVDADDFVDGRVVGSDSCMQFKGKLKTDAGKNQAEASSTLQASPGGILVAAPGKGKTVMALHAAAAVGKRTLVVVPTQALMDQWIARILQFTNLTQGEIGVVQGDTCEWKRPIIIAMVQSLSQKEYAAGLYATVGVFITDEVHRIGAPTWLQVVPRFPAMYRWGLSATYERADGLHKAFMLHIGEVVYEMLELDSQPTVYQILTGTQLPVRSMTNAWNGRTNFSKMYSSLAQDGRRNNIIAEEVKNCWKAGRKVLVLSKRVQHLGTLYHLALQKGVPADQMGTIVGQEKNKGDRARVLATRKVIWASEQIAGLGLDQPDLDTLHWALPSQAVEQNVGRIERVDVVKKKPLAFDYVDEVGMLQRLAKSRLKKFKKRGYQVIVVDKRMSHRPA